MIAARFGAIVLGLFAAACTGAEPTDRAAMDRRIGALPIHRTDHFSIHFDTDPDLARAIGERAEAIYAAVTCFCKQSGIDLGELAAPMRVVLFDRMEDYGRLRRHLGVEFRDAVGFYSRPARTLAFFNLYDHPDVRRITGAIRPLEVKLHDEATSMDAIDRKGLEARISQLKAARDGLVEGFHHVVIQHETVHSTLDAIGVCGRRECCPDWLAEGLACLFEVDQPEVSEHVLRPNAYRLGDLRAAFAAGVEDRKAAPDSSAQRPLGMPVPLLELLGDFGASSKNQADLYAESWALIHYLLHAKPDCLFEYLRAVAQCSASGEPSAVPPSFESAFGRPTAQWEKDWIAFVTQVDQDDAGRAVLAPQENPR